MTFLEIEVGKQSDLIDVIQEVCWSPFGAGQTGVRIRVREGDKIVVGLRYKGANTPQVILSGIKVDDNRALSAHIPRLLNHGEPLIIDVRALRADTRTIWESKEDIGEPR